MAKIMLVEDDNNLREIYEARLLAEGYEIVSAKDGEEALALAVKEKPDLIISDVMMPKISGFDMLDILRSTPETKDTRVIMMTALSQAEDKSRADKLGADRYLVKSQVTLEDVAKVARDVLSGENAPAAPISSDSGGAFPAAPAPTPVIEPTTVAIPPTPPTADDSQSSIPPSPSPSTDDVDTVTEEGSAELPKVEAASAAVPPAEQTDDPGEKAAELVEVVKKALEGATPVQNDNSSTSSSSDAPSQHKKIIQPISPLETKPDIHELAKLEDQKETVANQVPVDTQLQVATPAPVVTPSAQSTSDPATSDSIADQTPLSLPPVPPSTADTQAPATPLLSTDNNAPSADSAVPVITDASSTTNEAVAEVTADIQAAQTADSETKEVEVQINQFITSAPADTAVEAPLEIPGEVAGAAQDSAEMTPPLIESTPTPLLQDPITEASQVSGQATESTSPAGNIDSSFPPLEQTATTAAEDATDSTGVPVIEPASASPAAEQSPPAADAPPAPPDPNDPNSIAL